MLRAIQERVVRPVGGTADVAVDARIVADARGFCSLSRNTPFDGWNFIGRAVLTMVAGQIAYEDL